MPGMIDVTQALRALLAATPEPPDADDDPSSVLEVAQAALAAREPHVAALRAHLAPGAPLDPAQQQLLDAIRQRDERWEAAMTHARHTLGERIIGAQRARSSQPW